MTRIFDLAGSWSNFHGLKFPYQSDKGVKIDFYASLPSRHSGLQNINPAPESSYEDLLILWLQGTIQGVRFYFSAVR